VNPEILPPEILPPTILPLALRDLTFEAGGRRLVDSISADITSIGRTIVLGPNGAGKSLLLRLCHGLLRPTGGSVRWMGTGAHEAARAQAMVFQRPVMLRRTVAANIAYALKLRRMAPGEAAQRVESALERTGLAPLAATPARVLSGGEQQRLALARAWALEPQVLFLDEPTANLDPAATGAVEKVMQAIHESGTKIIMTTHDLAQARRCADEVIFLHQGRIIERDAAERFFTRPRTKEAAAFIAGELLW
jgi:tungstate transport system ATP-binding protein